MNRRDLFKVMFAAGLASVVPAVVGETLPTIYGDGIHDDTEGLQAALNGDPFNCMDGHVHVAQGQVRITGGLYRVSKPLKISRQLETTINYCQFDVGTFAGPVIMAPGFPENYFSVSVSAQPTEIPDASW